MRHRHLALVLVCAAILSGVGQTSGAANPAGLSQVMPQALGEAVWVSFASPEELALLAQRLDIWEVERATATNGDNTARRSAGTPGGRVKAWTSSADRRWLKELGFTSLPLPTSPPADGREGAAPATIPSYPCYRTIDELYAQLAAWAASYPGLTHLRSLGDSYEGRPIYALRLTNEATGLNKPELFVVANVHGRELITPEVAMALIERLLTTYDIDADVTWILDSHIVEVMVSANPDGHVRNEAGQPWAYWRKNTNPTYGTCGGTDFGIDLNRNSSFQWGGASPFPCDVTYQGPSPQSEPETQVVEAFLASLFPDERPDDLVTPAPLDKPGVFLTLHSYSNLVLWPWGHTYDPAPNDGELAQLGRKMASYNGYVAQQASDLYPATGTTDDYAYGDLGVASYTFEIGSVSDGFYPPCSRYDALVDPNVEALLYAAKVARLPYRLPAGPDAENVTAEAMESAVSASLTVTATVSDHDTGGQTIAAAEVYVGLPPWDGGQPYPLAAVDGLFDTVSEVVSATLPLPPLELGRRERLGVHLVFVRGRDASGAWGPVAADFVTVTRGLTLTPAIYQGIGDPGEVLTYSLIVTNTGALTHTLVLSQAGGRWPVLLVPTTTVQPPGFATPVAVAVAIPDELAGTTHDAVTVTASALEASWLARRVRIETSALAFTLFLPSMMRSTP